MLCRDEKFNYNMIVCEEPQNGQKYFLSVLWNPPLGVRLARNSSAVRSKSTVAYNVRCIHYFVSLQCLLGWLNPTIFVFKFSGDIGTGLPLRYQPVVYL
jgi:hypothetical protein